MRCRYVGDRVGGLNRLGHTYAHTRRLGIITCRSTYDTHWMLIKDICLKKMGVGDGWSWTA